MNKKSQIRLVYGLIVGVLLIGIFSAFVDSSIGLEKTGESMPSSGSSSPADSSGGGRGGGSSVTNVYNTYNTIEDKEIEGESEDNKINDGGEEVGVSGSSWLTGGVIGTNLLSGGSIVIIVAILCGTFIIFIIVRHKTAIRIKKK